MHKNNIGPKLQPIISNKRKLKEIVKKRGKVPLYPYFHPLTLDCENVSWLDGLLL